MHPPGQQRQRHVHGREEQRHEHGHLDQRTRLLGAQEHRDPDRPQRGAEVHPETEQEQAGQLDAIAFHPHPGDQAGDRHDRPDDQPAHQRAHGVARDDPAAARRAEHQPACEPRLEVARHGEAREHAAEGGGLQEHERELERRVAGPVVEVRDFADPRQPAGERDEEEQREDDRRHDDRRVDERVVDRAPGDRAGDIEEAPHVRASLDLIAGRASASADEREPEARTRTRARAPARSSPGSPGSAVPRPDTRPGCTWRLRETIPP